MPYIKQARRELLDQILRELWAELMAPTIEPKHGDEIPKTLNQAKGEINYCFTKILNSLLSTFGVRYHNLSNIHAIPVDVANEFRRRKLEPYEDNKINENGDVGSF